jgi:hypothetical protein
LFFVLLQRGPKTTTEQVLESTVTTHYRYQKFVTPQSYWAGVSADAVSVSARDVIAACPAAVAASRDRFLSASGVELYISNGKNRDQRKKRTSFLLPLNLGHNCLDLCEVKVLTRE